MTDIPTERRRFPRVACRTTVQHRELLRPGGPPLGGLSRDLSEGGIQFETAQFFACQSRLVLEVTLPDRVPPPIRTVAQVVWISRQAQSERYTVGAQFIEIQPQDRQRVVAYVERTRYTPSRPPA